MRSNRRSLMTQGVRQTISFCLVNTNNHLKRAIAGGIILTTALFQPAQAIETVEKSMTINATPDQVMNAIVKHRTAEPGKRKIVSTSKSGVVIREQLVGSIGLAKDIIVYEETIRSDNQIDFHLIDANKLTKFQGSWTISESKPGFTHVKLTTSVDSWMNVPFKDRILRHETARQLDKRLSFVKHEAEQI